MITAEQRRQLLAADRSGNRQVITDMVQLTLAAGVSALDVELALRDGAAHTYLIAGKGAISIVLGMAAWRAELERSGVTPEQNRRDLADN
jgi:hypothetical protein